MDLAIIYHINFNHLSLSFSQRVEYIEKYFDLIIKNVIVETNLSICAEDLIILKIWNPRVFKQLINHPKIKFLYTSYSHVTNALFPEYYLKNLMLGKKILENEILPDKLQSIYYPAEVDWIGDKNFNDIAALYKGIVLGETKIDIPKLRKDEYPPFVSINNGNNDLIAIISRRKFNYRTFIHNYYLDGITDDELYDAINQDWEIYANNKILVARIDLEIIPFNTPTIDGEIGSPPINKFIQFQKYFIKNKVNFVFLNEIFRYTDEVLDISPKTVSHDDQEDYKWNNDDLVLKLNRLSNQHTTKRQYLIWNSLLCSDYYYSNLEPWVRFNYKDKKKKVFIIKDRTYRDKESEIKLKLLIDTNYDTISEIEDNNLKKYFMYFWETVLKVEKDYL